MMNNHITYLKKSKEIISRSKFNPSQKDKDKLIECIKEGYGKLITLNKNANITMQYHGRFKSFIIGLGINPNNAYQPEVILFRIDTIMDENHKNGNYIFSKNISQNQVHIHWNNSYIKYIVEELNSKIIESKNSYEFIINNIYKNNNLSDKDLRKGIPNHLFKDLIINYGSSQIINNYYEITLEKNASIDPLILFEQIINQELTFFKN